MRGIRFMALAVQLGLQFGSFQEKFTIMARCHPLMIQRDGGAAFLAGDNQHRNLSPMAANGTLRAVMYHSARFCGDSYRISIIPLRDLKTILNCGILLLNDIKRIKDNRNKEEYYV